MCHHGDQINLNKFALINKDYETVINHHIYKEDYLQGNNYIIVIKNLMFFSVSITLFGFEYFRYLLITQRDFGGV